MLTVRPFLVALAAVVLASACTSSSHSSSTSLVLTTLLSGEIVALNRQTGAVVWTHALDGGSNGWMSAAGDQLIVPVGNAEPSELVAYRLP